MNKPISKYITEIKCHTKNLAEYTNLTETFLNGNQMKPYSLIYSRYRHCLLIDPETNHCLYWLGSGNPATGSNLKGCRNGGSSSTQKRRETSSILEPDVGSSNVAFNRYSPF